MTTSQKAVGLPPRKRATSSKGNTVASSLVVEGDHLIINGRDRYRINGPEVEVPFEAISHFKSHQLPPEVALRVDRTLFSVGGKTKLPSMQIWREEKGRGGVFSSNFIPTTMFESKASALLWVGCLALAIKHDISGGHEVEFVRSILIGEEILVLVNLCSGEGGIDELLRRGDKTLTDIEKEADSLFPKFNQNFGKMAS